MKRWHLWSSESYSESGFHDYVDSYYTEAEARAAGDGQLPEDDYQVIVRTSPGGTLAATVSRSKNSVFHGKGWSDWLTEYEREQIRHAWINYGMKPRKPGETT